jgi:hypothetical protein
LGVSTTVAGLAASTGTLGFSGTLGATIGFASGGFGFEKDVTEKTAALSASFFILGFNFLAAS